MIELDRRRSLPGANQLLTQIPDGEGSYLREHMVQVTFQAGDILHERQQPMEDVFFLQSGVVSLMIDLDDGFQADAGLIGSEGMVGVSLLSGSLLDVAAAVAQTDGSALRVPGSVFVKSMQASPGLRAVLLRYVEALRTQAMQLAACNGHHGLEQRLARCLLMLQDRQHGHEIPITHEALSALLSAHRPSVSVAAKRLREGGVIRYASGKMLVADRPGLEAAACECYALIRDHTRRLIGS